MFREKVDKKELNKFIKTSNKVLQLVHILVLVLVALLVTYVVKEWKILDFILDILKVISPVFIGLLIAWLLDPLVTKMEKKMNRVVACIITYLLLMFSEYLNSQYYLFLCFLIYSNPKSFLHPAKVLFQDFLHHLV